MRRLVGAICMMTGAALFAATGFSANPQSDTNPLTPSGLVGLVVLTSNGIEVGKVAGISTAPGGRIERIRVVTASTPKSGERSIIVAQPTFTFHAGVVVLDLSIEDFWGLPTAMAHDNASQ